MRHFNVNLLTLAVISALSFQALADQTTTQAASQDAGLADEKAVEVSSVLGKRVSYDNNTTDENMKLLQAPIGNVMDLLNNLPGINVG